MRKHLVLVRAGDKSLHPQWMEPDRNWDLALSYYGHYPERFKDQYDILHLFKGSKWSGIADFVRRHEPLLADYELIWLPDDDLFCNCATIHQFFELCRHLKFTIAQPALTPYSHYSWPITVSQPDTIARVTDFVEIMAPCFNGATWPLFKDTFSENESGFGLEWLWKKIALQHGVFNFGIVDATPIYHTRPVGGAGHGGCSSNPMQEMRELLEKFDLRCTQPKTLKRIT
jgi:hypothetical protein